MKKSLIAALWFMSTSHSVNCATQELAPYGTHLSLEESRGLPTVYLNFEGGSRAVVTVNTPDPYLDRQFMRFGKGPITILLGTSTAGKTTLIKKILQSNCYLLDCSLDLCWEHLENNVIKHFYPKSYAAIANVTNQSVSRLLGDRKDTLKFKQGTSQAVQNKITKVLSRLNTKFNDFWTQTPISPIEDFIFEQIIASSQGNRSLVFDVVGIESALGLFLKNFYAPFQIQLVFVPFNELSKRMVIRNKLALESGEGSNMRPQFPLFQYARLYRPVQNAQETVLETLSRSEAVEAMDRHQIEESIQLEILMDLGFTSPDVTGVAITSRFQHYHQLIRN